MKEYGIVHNVDKLNKLFYTNIHEPIPFHIFINTNKQNHFKAPDKLVYEIELFCNVSTEKIIFAKIQKIKLFLMDENTYIIDYRLIISNENNVILTKFHDVIYVLNNYYELTIYQDMFDEINSIDLLEELSDK